MIIYFDNQTSKKKKYSDNQANAVYSIYIHINICIN